MTAVIDIFLILHFIGLAAIIGSYMTVLKAPRVIPGMLHGAILQVVSGLALVGLNEANDADLNHMKVGIKLVIAIVILVAAVLGLRKAKEEVPVDGGTVLTASSTATLAHVIGVLALVNVVIAVVW